MRTLVQPKLQYFLIEGVKHILPDYALKPLKIKSISKTSGGLIMKQNDYNDIALSLAGMLNALSHPARLQIMLHLAKYNGCQARSISERLPLAKSTVSEHLNKLKEAGLITCELDGTSSYYQISEQGYQLVQNGFSDFIQLMEKHRAAPQKCCPAKQKQQKILSELA